LALPQMQRRRRDPGLPGEPVYRLAFVAQTLTTLTRN
jgi:hypothetical protein